jgi:hypothetical protein
MTFIHVVFYHFILTFFLSSRAEELKEELALGVTMALNAWHLHIGILKVTQYTMTARIS